MKSFITLALLLVVFAGSTSCTGNGKQEQDTAAKTKDTGTVQGKPFIIEIVDKNNTADTALMKNLCVQYNLPASQIYQWQNHYVIYASGTNAETVTGKFKSSFPEDTVKAYASPFYEFNRNMCGDTTKATQWDHIILTANLVKDTLLQKEYMAYHASQFQQWPEVSKGFCNANFQQLLVFRNGRQLMLVISIPKGASLDELNPKTTENNPRVDEWNTIMKNYQEGIEGTKKGEVWVFLNKI